MKIIDSFKPAELAEEIDVSVGTLARWRGQGQGPRFVRIAGRIHYMRTDVVNWVQSQINAA